ncbi:MAG: hypothetical protein ACI9WU_003550 [Myxococcota bacterium]|jgi:hypothetical protein
MVEEDAVNDPHRNPTLPFPEADYLVQLADAIIATRAVAERDERQRAMMVVEARELFERIEAGLIAVEDADPT